MADEKPRPAGGQDAAALRIPPVQITTQYVKDLSFENPSAPQTLAAGTPAPQVTVSVDVKTQQLAENSFEVVLAIKADAKAADKQAFVVELAYAGVVSTANVPKELTAPVLLIEAPRLLFPFARSVIADATRDGGFPPLLVQPIDFTELFRRQIAALRARQDAGAAAPQPTVN